MIGKKILHIVQAAVLVLISQSMQQTEKHGALGLMCETPPFLCLRQASYPLTSRTHQMWNLFEMCDHLTELKRCLEKEDVNVCVCVFFVLWLAVLVTPLMTFQHRI